MSVEDSKDLIPALPTATEIKDVETSVKAAEQYIEVMGRIRLAAIKLTNKLDWCNQNGKPYLEKSGCDKVAAAFGIKIFDINIEKENVEDDNGKYIIYTCHGCGKWNNHEESEIGTCSTRDEFFGKAGGKFRPLSEIDLTDIKKKAFTNFANRIIKKLIGLSFTWDEIRELSNGKITEGNTAGVSYTGGKQGGNTDSPETKAKRDQIKAMLMTLCDGEEPVARAQLVQLTSFEKDGKTIQGKDSTLKLTEKQVNLVFEKLKKEIESQ